MAAFRRSEPALSVRRAGAGSTATPPARRRSGLAGPLARLRRGASSARTEQRKPRRLGGRSRVAWPVAAMLAGAAASTLVTAGAATVAGREADLALDPVELALRVGLLLAAPCVGALLAALLLPGDGGRPAVVGVGVGVPFGPLLVLRLDRLRDFGLVPTLLTVAVLVLWGLIGALLAAGWWARPARGTVERTRLPARSEPDPAPDPGPVPGTGRGADGAA